MLNVECFESSLLLTFNRLTFNRLTFNLQTFNLQTFNVQTFNLQTFNLQTFNRLTFNRLTFNLQPAKEQPKKRASRSLTRSFLYGINCEGKQNIGICLGVMSTQRRKRLDMISLLLADLSTLRLFPASHKFDQAARALLNHTAIGSSARGLDLVLDVVARSR